MRDESPIEEGGDAACWLDLLCPSCGRLGERSRLGERCPACGTLLVERD